MKQKLHTSFQNQSSDELWLLMGGSWLFLYSWSDSAISEDHHCSGSYDSKSLKEVGADRGSSDKPPDPSRIYILNYNSYFSKLQYKAKFQIH